MPQDAYCHGQSAANQLEVEPDTEKQKWNRNYIAVDLVLCLVFGQARWNLNITKTRTSFTTLYEFLIKDCPAVWHCAVVHDNKEQTKKMKKGIIDCYQ